MTYVGRCPECGLRAAVGADGRLRRHGFSYAANERECAGTGKQSAVPVVYLQGGRAIRQDA